MEQPKILVVGSINKDLFVTGAHRIPSYGETIRCGEYGFASGGKGSNQAFAVARLGGAATFVGRIGDDDYGKKVTASLGNAGVNTDYLVVDPDTQTGLALMPIEPDTGRYACYVAMGGNDRLCPEDVKKAMDAQAFDMVLMQLEMPLETIYGTIELAKEHHIPVFLDAGPAIDISLERLKGLFIISPNEAETFGLTGICPDTDANAFKAARLLYEKTAPTYVILKLGDRGILLYDGKESLRVPCFKVDAVDSTAAGDTFGAALAISLCKGLSMMDAIRYAQAAAGICVSRTGAQSSIPTPEEICRFLDSHPNLN